MDNRFGFRDFVLAALLVAIGVLIYLSMVQDDRMHEDIKALRQSLETQTENLVELERTLRSRAARAPATRSADGSNTGQSSSDTGFPDASEVNNPIKTFPEARPRIRQARQQPNFNPGGTLVDAFPSNVESLTPLISSSLYATQVQDYVLERLGQLDLETLEYEGLLAQRWVVENNADAYRAWKEKKEQSLRTKLSNDASLYQKQLKVLLDQATEPPEEGTDLYQRYVQRAKDQWVDEQLRAAEDKPTPITIHFELREGLTFADGRALTAEDVAYGYETVMSDEYNTPRMRAYYQMIEDVEAVGPRYLKVTYAEPYFEALQLAASLPAIPKHIYQEIPPSEFNTSKALLFGSGPYQLRNPREWRPGEPIVLQRNPRYWTSKPAFERVVFRQFTNSTARLTSFRNGDIDLISPEPEQFKTMLEDKELVARTRHFNYMSPYNGYRYIAWNQQNANGEPSKFADKRVRRAMTLLLDRQQMINNVMLGYARICTGPFHPLGEQPAPSVEPWPHNVKRAKALLKEAGWADRDGDGLLENEQGQPFRFSLTFPSGSPNYKKMAFYLQDAFAAAGVDMKLNPLEFSVMVQRLDRKNFDAITLQWSSGPETDIYQMFHSDQMLANGDNFMSYRSPKLDELIEQARSTVDKSERMKMWHQCHEILHEDQPYTFLFWVESRRFLNDRIQNAKVLKAGMNTALEWYVPAQKQTSDRLEQAAAGSEGSEDSPPPAPSD
jgi:peptide/nickel transport system substrate-binding protein